jgi:hypothetical protein
MKNTNANILGLFGNHLFLKEYLLKMGVVESKDNNIKGKLNTFSVSENNLNFQLTEYYAAVDIRIILSFFMPHFTKNEINQVVSMFEFHHNLFCVPMGKNEVFHFVVTNNHVTFSSKLVEFQVTKHSFEIYQECSFFESAYSLKKLTVDDFQKVIIEQLKKSLSLYFNEDIKKVNNTTIANVVNESIESYDVRINHKAFFKKWTDHSFYKNINDSKLSYILKNYIYEDEESDSSLSFLENKNIAIIKQESETHIVELENLKDRVSLFVDVNKMDVIRTVLKPIFHEKELSSLLSIISLMNFIEQIENPYSIQKLISIEKEPTLFDSKEYVFCTNYIFNISVGDFSLNIGRETEIRSYSLHDYNYSSDKFNLIYKSLVNLLKKWLTKSLDVETKELTFEHVKIQQMKNS